MDKIGGTLKKTDFRRFLQTQSSDALAGYLRENNVAEADLNEGLKWACYAKDTEAVRVFLGGGADPNYEDDLGGTVFDFAMRGDNEEIISLLLQHLKEHDWNPTKKLTTLLHWACQKGYNRIVETIIEAVPDCLDEFNEAGHAALHVAVLHSQIQVTESLISCGVCRVNSIDNNQLTPLHYACSETRGSNYGLMIRELVAVHGADPTVRSDEGKTALDLAFENGRVDELVTAMDTESRLVLMIDVDNVIPAQISQTAAGRITRPQLQRSRQHSSSLGGLLRNTDLTPESSATDSKNEERKKILVRAWRKIILNDDIEMLILLRDSQFWRNKTRCSQSFEDSQDFDEEILTKIFKDCYENGIGLYTYVQTVYAREITGGDLQAILAHLTGLQVFEPIQENETVIIPSLHKSLTFLAFLCGRFRVAELLLRMRQFDIIPASLLLCLIAHRLQSERSFSQQIKNAIQQFATTTESIAVDAVSRLSINDYSQGKRVCLETLELRLSAYGNISWIDLADMAHCTNFLSLPCCQVVLDKRWNGKLTDLPMHWRWLVRLCPLLLLVFISRRRTPMVMRSRKMSIDLSSYRRVSYSLEHDIDQLRKGTTLDRFKYMRYVYQAPSTKFYIHAMFHFLFLALFSYVVLFEFHFNPTTAEMLCVSFIVGYAFEEVRQFSQMAFRNAYLDYIGDVWNWLDIIALVVTITGFILRCFRIGYYPAVPQLEPHEPVLYWSRVILISGLVLLYIRILFIVSISSVLGPKLKMIGNMLVKDLLPLLIIFVIFIVSFGVAFQALLYPNGYSIDRTKAKSNMGDSLGNLFRRAFYGLFGSDYPLDELICADGSNCPNPLGKDLVLYFYHVLYVLIVNTMLLNLLIALFSNTVARIDQRSTEHWLADRYKLVEEFKGRSVLPPPLNIISVVAEIVLQLIACCRGKKQTATPRTSYTNPLVGPAVIDGGMSFIMRHLVIQTLALKGNRYTLGNTPSSKSEVMLKKKSKQKLLEEQIQAISTKVDKILEGLDIVPKSTELIESRITHKQARSRQNRVTFTPTDRDYVDRDVIINDFMRKLEDESAV